MTDALTIIEQTEPRVLLEARAFVLTTLDDVQQLRKDWRDDCERWWRSLYAARQRVEVHPHFTSD